MIDAAGRLRCSTIRTRCTRRRARPGGVALRFVSRAADAQRARRLARYWKARDARPDPAAIALLVVQRTCKDYGRFRFVTEVKHDTRYAPFVARARAAVLGALPGLPATHRRLAAILGEAQGAAGA
jgi:hypothetical protein